VPDLQKVLPESVVDASQRGNHENSLLTTAIVLAGLYFGRDILIPPAIAFLITFALNPAVTWLDRRGLPRLLATCLVILTVMCVLLGLGAILGTQVRSIAVQLPAYQSTILTKLSDLRQKLKAPGLFDSAMKTVERVQKEVESKDEKSTEGPEPQRVEIVPTAQTPFEQAFAIIEHAGAPLATAGIILIFVFLALLDIGDLRDRFIRLLGGNFHRSTDAIQEAGARISRYLLMQLVINFCYGVPLAAGLWIIGVPGAPLWGAVGAVMRFVPYIGPLIAAVFPIALAFAVDNGWSMLLWTVGLIVVLELTINNLVEPLLYGSSTGLSAIALIAAAILWTSLWGPVGLILSTPLTVCLLVLGRNLPQLRFLETMLGSTPALDVPARIYQRLIADDPDEAVEIASAEIEKSSVSSFYNATGIEVLRLASEEYFDNASAEHRLRLVTGTDSLLKELRDEFPVPPTSEATISVLCIGGKWEIDALAGTMLAHALAFDGIFAVAQPAASVNADYLAKLDLRGADIVCLSYFTPNPAIPARHASRRLRRRWPNVRIVLALWNAPPELLTEESLVMLGADTVVTSVEEAVLRIQRMIAPEEAEAVQQAPIPDNDAERVSALKETGVLTGDKREALDALAKRAADVFNTRVAVITTIDKDREYFVGQSGKFPNAIIDDTGTLQPMDRQHAICNYVVANEETLVVSDIERDPRFADNETIEQWNMRFYAGAPLRATDGLIIGALCILDNEPRTLEENEVALLETMAGDVAATITTSDAHHEASAKSSSAASSATVGQPIPP
jgi:predicted PurR-regulated permease PerM